ncbi:MAG: gliding motility-associated C-terminal domain-containing protein [Crocinitomicaceae bacterium]
MKGKDEIKDLFSNKFGDFEPQVRPDMWANIANQIGGKTVSVVSTGLSLLSKAFIGIGIGVVVVTTVLIVTPSKAVPIEKEKKNPISRETHSEEIKEIVVSILDEVKINSAPHKKEKIQLDNNSPATLVNSHIDQTENLRSDISLMEVKKEKDKSNVVNDASVVKDKPVVGAINIDKKELKNAGLIETPQSGSLEIKHSLEALPNVFTPDGDGTNDFLTIKSEGLIDFTVVVFDYNQKVVFESNSPDFKWNGIDKFGNKVKPGTYGYYIIAQDSNGNKVNKFTALQILF